MFEVINLILAILTFITLIIYAYFTYLIARDVYEPLVSFSLSQREFSHLNFHMVNKSKVEVEVFGKLWSKEEGLESRGGFYGDKTPWVLQPFTEGYGHFDLKEMTNKEGIGLEEITKKRKISSLKFNLQIKYRQVGRKRWKIVSPQKFTYNFDNNQFCLNV